MTDDPGSDPFRLEEDLVVIVGPLQLGVFGVLRTDRTVVSVRQRNTKLATSCTVAGISIRGKNTERREREAERKDCEKGRKSTKETEAAENSTKVLLTGKYDSHDTPVALVTFGPSSENVPTFLSYPHAGKNVSKEHRCRHK